MRFKVHILQFYVSFIVVVTEISSFYYILGFNPLLEIWFPPPFPSFLLPFQHWGLNPGLLKCWVSATAAEVHPQPGCCSLWWVSLSVSAPVACAFEVMSKMSFRPVTRISSLHCLLAMEGFCPKVSLPFVLSWTLWLCISCERRAQMHSYQFPQRELLSKPPSFIVSLLVSLLKPSWTEIRGFVCGLTMVFCQPICLFLC